MLEGRLEDWVKKASKEGKVLTDALLRRKAREFGDAMGYTEDKFKASSGWLENFKHRYGIRRGQYFGQGKMHKAIHAYAGEAYVNSDLRDFARESMLEDRAREDAEAAAAAAAAAMGMGVGVGAMGMGVGAMGMMGVGVGVGAMGGFVEKRALEDPGDEGGGKRSRFEVIE